MIVLVVLLFIQHVQFWIQFVCRWCAGPGFQQTRERKELNGWRNSIKPYWTFKPGTGSPFVMTAEPAHPPSAGPLVKAFCELSFT